MSYKKITDFKYKTNDEVDDSNIAEIIEIQQAIWDSEKYYFDKREAKRVFNFSKKLTADKGKRQGKLKLLVFQFNIISDVLCVKNRKTGHRRFTEVHINVGRKNGKSFIVGFINDYIFFFRCEQGAEFIIVANTREQATLLYDQAMHFIKETPLKNCCKITDSKKIVYNLLKNARMRVISSDSSKADSFADMVFCMDEIHECKQPAMYDKLITGQGIYDEPLGITITTASSGDDPLNLEMIMYDYSMKLDRGEIEDESFYYAIYKADEGCEITDRTQWYKANPALGKFRKISDIEKLCKKAMQSNTLERTFRRYFLNQHVSAEIENAINIALFEKAMQKVDYEKIKHLPNTAGLDLSSTSDITAYVQCFDDNANNKYIIYPHLFTPLDILNKKEDKDHIPYNQWYREGYFQAFEGEYIDYASLHKYIKAHREDNRLVAFDRWGSPATQSELETDFDIWGFGQGYRSMSPAIKEFEKMLVEGKLIIAYNPALLWMAKNVVAVMDDAGNIKYSKRKSKQKIDGIIAMIMSIAAMLSIRNEYNINEEVEDFLRSRGKL